MKFINALFVFLIGFLFGYGVAEYAVLEEDESTSIEEEVVVEDASEVDINIIEEVSTPKSQKKTSKKKAERRTFNEGDEGFNAKALTLQSYAHDWCSRAQVVIHNNTNETIASYTYRLIYYDMSGNMLHYKDFTHAYNEWSSSNEAIEPQMSRTIEETGFNISGMDYIYYKSKDYKPSDHKLYKVKFELKSYTLK